MLRTATFALGLPLILTVLACGDDDGDPADAGATGGCSVTETDDGDALIRCDDGTEHVVKNGADGAPGDEGERGDEGEKGDRGDRGETGMAGTGCTIEENDAGAAVITCADGSSVTLEVVGGPQGPSGMDARSAGAGFALDLIEARVDDERHPVVTVRLTDADGRGLDRAGNLTEGAVGPRFTVAHLSTDGVGWLSYIVEAVTSPTTNDTADQATDDGGDGTWSVIDGPAGTYEYRFTEPLPEGYDPAATHRIAAWATRTVDGVRYADDDAIDFRPDGDTDLEQREISTTETCNGCHNPLALHGSQRLSMELCVTCHTSQAVDPDTGNSVDARVMFHKIHMGHSLPSVVSGTPYQVIGFRQSVHDYSEVGFPHEVNHCPTCHTGEQAAVWSDNPTIEACGSCHDDIDFALPTPDPDPGDAIVPHPGGPRDNGSCTTCHAVGALPGLSIQESHQRGKLNPNTPELTVEILGVTNTAPADTPTIEFRVLVDGAGRDLAASPLDSLRFVLAGPATGITGQRTYTPDQATELTVGSGAGVFSYTLPETLTAAAAALDPTPASATGTFGIMAEGRHTFVDVARPDGTTEDVRVGFHNPAVYFAVTGASAEPRREVVTDDKCNTCHRSMSFHGDNRSSVDACVFCHNANLDTLGRMPTPATGTTVDTTTVRFGPMIHRIHGSAIASGTYILYSPSSALDFTSLGFPGAAEDCTSCHEGDSYDLPLTPDLPPTVTRIKDASGVSAGVADTVPVITSNCIGCHDDLATRDHAEIMTTATGGESCATCHAAGSSYGVDVVHARPQWDN